MRLLVLGAGVIGQVYAGRLSLAGHDVTVVAHGATFELLNARGIRLVTGGAMTDCAVKVVRAAPSDEFDGVVLAVRFDQLDTAVEALNGVLAKQVITLGNLADQSDRAMARWGRDRTALAFPGSEGFVTMRAASTTPK
jgi:2-dehydropantoate 2-reductase